MKTFVLKVVGAMDRTDQEILRYLSENSRVTMKELGSRVHLSPPAVAERIRRLEDEGIIRKYTVDVDRGKTGYSVMAFITVYLSSGKHEAFVAEMSTRSWVLECHRVAGEGCYLLKVVAPDHITLNHYLELILPYGNYKLSVVLTSPVQQTAHPLV